MTTQSLAQLDPDGLEAYFTDVEHLRELFKTLVAAPTLPKRLLVIHGVGGVGKSSLLRMFRLHCKREDVPVALASGDEAKSAVDILTGWAADLKVDGVKLPTFTKTAQHYRAIQAKVEEQVRKAREVRDNAAGALGKAAAKTIVETAVSAIPVVGPFITGLSGMGAEALVDWLGSFLKKPDIDLLLDPTKALTDDFRADLARVAPKRRLVLMLDTFEQMSALEDWTRDLAQQLHFNILLVVAGRAVPNWSRHWSGWLAQANLQELIPMSEPTMRELINRYYATMRGGEPDPTQVEAILTFARGLPIVVTSAVRLWVQYGVEDFQAVKPQVVADLVDRLLEGVPAELAPALEAAAVVRWFNKDILQTVMDKADVNAIYEELRRFPFTRPRVEGLAIHDAVREIMDENLSVHAPERYRHLHNQSITYFKVQLAQTTSQKAERLELELLYHGIRVNEEAGIQLFQEMAEELVRYRLVNRLRVLLNDVNTYPLEYENTRLWKKYYNARLDHLEMRFTEAAKMYEAIDRNESAESKLKAYALCDWGDILARSEHLSQPKGVDQAFDVLERSRRLAQGMDIKLASIFTKLRNIYIENTEWEKAIESLTQQLQFYLQNNDTYGAIHTYNSLSDTYGLMGDWKKAADALQNSLQMLRMLPDNPSLKVSLREYGVWYRQWAGNYEEAARGIEDAVTIKRQIGDMQGVKNLLRGLGLVRGFQGRYTEATEYFAEVLEVYERRGGNAGATLFGFWGAVLLKQGNLDKAEDYLNQSLFMKERLKSNIGIPELLDWLGELYEVKAKTVTEETNALELATAESYFRRSLDYRWTNRHNFECGALAGLVRVKHAQADYAPISPLLTEAEQLAQQYEYNDHLASLRLSQGHIAWDGHIPEWGSGFEAALRYYRQALIYALRYNRFLLDEVLWGGGVCTPLQPIIPHCQECGDEGRQMLAALHAWWQTGVNDLGTPRPDTISPIPEGISLLEAERIAREREPGDGSPQQTVLAQLEVLLGN